MRFHDLSAQTRLVLGVACFFSASLATAFGLHLMIGPASEPKETRGPASVVYDDDGHELYADDSIEDLERAGRKHFRGQKPSVLGPILSQINEPVSMQEASLNTGVKVSRARKMQFHQDTFMRLTKTREKLIKLPLFTDVQLNVQIRPSNYGTNSGVFTGQVVGDSSSRVEIFVGSGDINATIETHGRRFRILTSGRQAIHYVVEEDLKPGGKSGL